MRRERFQIVGDTLRLIGDGKGKSTAIRHKACYTHRTTCEIMDSLVSAGAVLWDETHKIWQITGKGRELLQHIDNVEATLGRDWQ